MPHTLERDQAYQSSSSAHRPLLEDIPSNEDIILHSPPKSAKRKRAEELLEKRYAQKSTRRELLKMDSSNAATIPTCSGRIGCSRYASI